jgi:hypothetical protein
MLADESKSPSIEYGGSKFYFVSGMHRLMFSLFPELFLKRQDDAIRDGRRFRVDESDE